MRWMFSRHGVWVFGLACLFGDRASAQVTQRVSVDSNGVEGNQDCGALGYERQIAVAANGRFVAFVSSADNLVVGDSIGLDIFVRDRRNGITERVSVDSTGAQANHHSYRLSMTPDGRYVAFESKASNLVIPDPNGTIRDVFVRDRLSGTTELVSGGLGPTGYGDSVNPCISADGRIVAFESSASNLVPGDSNFSPDVFTHDRQSNTTVLVSVDSNGTQALGPSGDPAMTPDGRFVAFASWASNLVIGDVNGVTDIFVRDTQTGTTELVSFDSAGAQSDDYSFGPSVSADGRWVAFVSHATNLVAGDTNGLLDVFLRDRQSGTTELVSVSSAGIHGNLDSYQSSISADGRYIVLVSESSNLVPGDTNNGSDVFVRDRQAGTTHRSSVDSSGVEGVSSSYNPCISEDGRFVGFLSAASNLVPNDTNARNDMFLRDRVGGPAFTSSCDPGVGGVLACPCSNPPSGPGRGCENSSSTGGAILSASGGTFLSSDSLVFTTSGQRPTSLSLLTQWSGSNSTGVVWGMGIRCTSGMLERLYTKHAVAGSLVLPDFGAGEPTISEMSAANGDTIPAGQSRWYVVYYRDGVVLGGCSATSNFNATQTGQVTWAP